jgi:hypothetical protein
MKYGRGILLKYRAFVPGDVLDILWAQENGHLRLNEGKKMHA